MKHHISTDLCHSRIHITKLLSAFNLSGVSLLHQFGTTMHHIFPQMISCLHGIVRMLDSPKRKKGQQSLKLRVRKIT